MQPPAQSSDDILHTYGIQFSGIIAGYLPPCQGGNFPHEGHVLDSELA